MEKGGRSPGLDRFPPDRFGCGVAPALPGVFGLLKRRKDGSVASAVRSRAGELKTDDLGPMMTRSPPKMMEMSIRKSVVRTDPRPLELETVPTVERFAASRCF